MPAGDIYSNRLIPSEINLQNFYDALFKNPIPRFVLNSFIVSIRGDAGPDGHLLHGRFRLLVPALPGP